jgi:hypothetical protein
MKTNLFNLIVVSPSSPKIWKIQVSKKALIIIALVFLFSFGITVAVVSSVPAEKLRGADHLKLQAENQALQIENRNIELRAHRIDAELSELEEMSKRINALMQAD